MTKARTLGNLASAGALDYIGTVKSLVAGTGLTGGTITTTGTIGLANTTVTAGSYTAANITIDAQGRITSASNGASASAGDSFTLGTVYGATSNNGTYKRTMLGYSAYIPNDATASTAIGYGATVSGGALNSTAIGSQARVESNAYASVTIGTSSVANAYYTTAIGAFSTANYARSVTVGYNSQASAQRAISIGTVSRANGYASVTIGDSSTLSGAYSIGIGHQAFDQGNSSVILNASGNALYVNSTGLYIDPIAIGTSNNVLYYDTSTKQITYGSPSSGNMLLGNITDVVLTSPTTGQVLQYNGINWVNATVSTGGTEGGGGTPSAGIPTGNTATAFSVGTVIQSGGPVAIPTPTSTSNGFLIAVTAGAAWASVYSVSPGLTPVSLTSGNYSAPWVGIYKASTTVNPTVSASVDPMNDGSPVSYDAWKITDTAQTKNWYATSYASYQWQNGGQIAMTIPGYLVSSLGLSSVDSIYLKMPSFGDSNRAATLQSFQSADPDVAYYYFSDSQTLMIRIPGSYGTSGASFGNMNVAGDLGSMGIQTSALIAGQ